ncbi:LuxR family two component transcriptional regulator [Promicromonospora sp. AC04]|uniref:response regulator n=1 Tax=Promicromonospora sp. AC04 TaxID=2135723 RepID=UPI000D3447D3|nr:response regulator transcription factor [Promicromonospora sp. AC04]PUB20924.1 LuxR family two component transcriptional regulator [Promicromonospora sp. AC04]
MTAPVGVLVVDDQPLIRHSLRLIIDGEPGLSVVGEADTGEGAVTRAAQLRPDVVLMDIRMPGGDGIDATRRIADDPVLNETRVLVLSMFELDEYVHAALRAGASGFLLKDAEPARLVDAIRRTHSGESLFAPSILGRLVAHYLDRPARRNTAPQDPTQQTLRGPDVLTDRETEVLTQVGRGLSNDEIAQALTISMGTVKSHIGNLLAKLHARDRAQLVIAAYDHGLVGAGHAGE